MARKTRKLTQALKVLSIEHDPELPNVVVYGEMAKRGFDWNGDRWIAKRPAIAMPIFVTVTAYTYADAIAASDLIADAIHDARVRVKLTPPTRSRDRNVWRSTIETL